MKIVVSTSTFASASNEPLDLLKSNGFEIVINPYGRKLSQEEIIKLLNGASGLLAGLESLDSTVFESAPMLKAISRIGIGLDNVDLDAANQFGIKVSNTPDAPTIAVAEMTIAAALSITRNIVSSNLDMHNKNWEKSIGFGLNDANVLFIGYGRIGQKTAEYFRLMGANIYVYDPNLTDQDIKENDTLIDLSEGLQLADIITIHSSGKTPIITDQNFRKIKKGAILLNSARGNLIEENVLIKALDDNIISNAWLDVFQEEPYYGDLCTYDNVLLTPHISTYTTQCRKNMEIAAVKNLIKILK